MTITTTAISGPSSGLPTAAGRHLRVASVLRSEWIKLRTVRSTWWTLAAMAVLTVGIAIIAGATIPSRWNTMSAVDRLTFDPTSVSLRGLLFSQLVIGVLGVLVMSAEYGTGTIRSTLAAVPNRPVVLAAKTAVFAAVALVVGEVLSFAAFFVGQALLTSPAPHATLGQPGVLRAVVGGGLVVAVLGLFALGLATIIRHTAGAITAFVGSLLVLPIVVQALPSSINRPSASSFPFNISDTMTTVHHGRSERSTSSAPGRVRHFCAAMPPSPSSSGAGSWSDGTPERRSPDGQEPPAHRFNDSAASRSNSSQTSIVAWWKAIPIRRVRPGAHCLRPRCVGRPARSSAGWPLVPRFVA